MRKAVVQKDTGLVLNVIAIAPAANWPVPDGCTLVDAETVGGIGDTWDGKQFVMKADIIPPPKKWGKKKA